jgi:predicted nucleic acid-binding protein
VIVVSNTSPLTNLAAIGLFDLLHRVYGELHIAEGVLQELNAHGRRWPGRDEVEGVGWVMRHDVKDRALVTALRRDVDLGEAESVALSLELAADLVLLDEREGRHAAERLGLKVVGTAGVLLEAKAAGAISSVQPHLDALRHTAGFYLSDPVYRQVLVLAGEGEG